MSITWAQRTTPTDVNHTWRGICWAAELGLFVAVGSIVTAGTTIGFPRVATSPDGVNWTPRNLDISAANTLVDVTWCSGFATPLLVACKISGTDRIATSPDGTNWTSRPIPEPNIWNAVAYSPTLNIAVAVASTGTNRGMSSTNGTAWTVRTISADTWSAVTWCSGFNGGSGRFVATTVTSSKAAFSNDGTTWTTSTPFGAQSGAGTGSIAYSPTLNRVVAIMANNDNPVWTSDDGSAWIQRTMPTTGANRAAWFGVCWNATLAQFVAVGRVGLTNTNQVATSADGITWVESDPGVGTPEPWRNIAASSTSGLVVAIADNITGDGLSVMSGSSAADGISPTSGHLGGGYALTITSAGGNGGFLPGARVFIDHFVTPFFLSGVQSNPTTITPATDSFSPVSAASFYNEATNVVVGSTASLTCNAPIGFSPEGSSLRQMDVLVLNPDSATLNIPCFISGGFTYLNPTITSVAASSGSAAGGTAVTVTGTNFYPFGGPTAPTSQNLYFGANLATSVVVTSSTSITCNTPTSTSATNPVDVVLRPLVYSPIAAGRGGYSLVYDANATATLHPGYTYTPSWFNLTSLPSEFIEFGQLCGDQSDEAIAYWSDRLGGEFVAWLMEFFCAFPFNFLSDIDLNWYVDVPAEPGTDWVPAAEPARYGWFQSIDGYAGASTLIIGGAPSNPRSFTEVAAFATGTAGMLGGFPGVGVNFRNHFIYAGGGYTVGTTAPTIRLFDGLSDRSLIAIPSTAAAVVPKAIMSMVAVGETIYLSTLDSGTSAADYAGRVFAFDPLSGSLTQIGAGFSAGEVPYALCWHMGRLWCGTNKGNGTTGKIYFFRPGIDTAWTLDYTLSTSSAGGACSMASFQGNLLVGVDQAGGTFAQVLSRSSLGAWSNSTTATGGVATLNNAFLYLKEFNSNLYATYWNPDTPAVAKIYKFDGTSWSTVYTGASGTIRPFIAMFVSKNILYTAGGGNGLTAALISSSNGTSWTDLSANLTGGTATAVPVFGEVII